MAINDSLLKHIAPKELVKASEFLNAVFVENVSQLIVDSPDDIRLLALLVRASDTKSVKTGLFFSLDISSKKRCFEQLPFLDQYIVLLHCKNASLVFTLFQLLEPSLKEQCLDRCFQEDPEQFKFIKKALRPSLSFQQGVMIEKAPVGNQSCQDYAKTIMEHLLDTTMSAQEIKAFVHQLQNSLDDADLEIVASTLFRLFYDKKLPLLSKDNFNAYLKFFDISVPLLVLFPHNMSSIDPILTHFLVSLDSLPSAEWIVKILDQVPLFILKKCCEKLSQHERIKSSKTRLLYAKFFAILTKQLDQDYASNIRTAFNQL